MRPYAFLRKFIRILGEVSLVMLLLLMVFLALATGLYFAERTQNFLNSPHNYQDSLYLSAVTALTIGYGDYVPHSTMGRCIALMLALTGVTLIGIVAGAAIKALELQFREHELREPP